MVALEVRVIWTESFFVNEKFVVVDGGELDVAERRQKTFFLLYLRRLESWLFVCRKLTGRLSRLLGEGRREYGGRGR